MFYPFVLPLLSSGSSWLDMGMLLLVPYSNQTIPTFFLVFLSVYLFSYFLVFKNWGPKQRCEASSSFMSLAHGTSVVIMAIQALIQTPDASLSSPNSSLHNTIFDFSLSYFLVDLLHYLVFFPKDFLFILHHVATLYVLITCRYVVHRGAYGLSVFVVLAEVTSPFQNVWSIAGYRKVDSPTAAKIHEFLSPPFFTFYSVVRGILGPLYAVKLCSFYLSGAEGVIPAWARVSWTIVIVAVILVSILWVASKWNRWFRERIYEAQKKGI